MPSFEYAIFGNRAGSHQLLETSLIGEDALLEELRFLVDRPAGHVGPEVVWSPYWGCGPLGDWWALWCGEEDYSAPRKNMVKSRVVLVRCKELSAAENIKELLSFLQFDPTRSQNITADTLVDALSRGLRPVVVPGISITPLLLIALWPRLWPALRQRLTVRTFFGSESLRGGTVPDIVTIPTELRLRWRSQNVVDCFCEQPTPDNASALFGDDELEHLLLENRERLPGDFTVLERLRRIAVGIKTLKEGRGRFHDALLIIRTVESFKDGLDLPQEDLRLLLTHVCDMRNAEITDIRAASLARLTIIHGSLSKVEEATSKWIEENLFSESDANALWILEHQAGNEHVAWWLRAVRKGLKNSFSSMTSDWARAIWRWWKLNSGAVAWTQSLLSSEPLTEKVLLQNLPREISRELQTRLRVVCTQLHWIRLLAGVLRITEPLNEGVRILRDTVSDPEVGLDILLEKSTPAETIAVAVECGWEPLIKRAAQQTSRNPALFDKVDLGAVGLVPLLAAHFSAGGRVPPKVIEHNLVARLFDGCIDHDKLCVDIILKLGASAASVALMYSRQDELWSALGPSRQEPLLSATGDAWLKKFLADEHLARPGLILSIVVRREGRAALKGSSIGRVIDFITLFPEMTEREVVDWLSAETFLWNQHDQERLGEILINRNWLFAAKRFRWSMKSELNAVAWHARDLLSFWDRFWSVPSVFEGARLMTSQDQVKKRSSKMMKILFLAANPMNSERLALDEEARSIEEKIRASKLREVIKFRTKWAVRPDDLQQALLEEEPTIVHFSGHGGGKTGIALHSEAHGGQKLVTSEGLAHLFKILKDNIRVVVLNACHSKEQAEAIVEEIDFVIGMDDSIGDEAARVFAAAFYRGLAFGRTVQAAFELGLNELKLMRLGDEDVPVMLTRGGLDANSVRLADDTTL